MNVIVQGLSYHVRVEGDPARERTAVLLHGFAGSSEDWGALIPVLRQVGLAVAAPDLPGHGSTGAPEDPARYEIASVVRDLDRLMDEIGAGQAIWLGYSMGGRVALHLALARPERVRSLVLESAGPGIEDPEARARRREADN